MENCAQLQLQSADEAPEQMAGSGVSTSVTVGATSSFHTALEECLPPEHDVALGDCSGGRRSMEPKSEYFSARVEEMMRSKSQFSSDVEHQIEHSRVHWSEVLGFTELSEEGDCDEEVSRENEEVYAELMNDPQWKHHEYGHFFMESRGRLGRKIAEGGQAAIFEVIGLDGNVSDNYLFKVFKRGSRLSDLQKQWPCGILRGEVPICMVHCGCMLDDGRFAFVMERCWGDLRKLIDQAMQEKNNQGPPFPYEWNGHTLLAKDIMSFIALDMKELHEKGILHRDLKAANILLKRRNQGIYAWVVDFECFIGVVGTGFWRAPEVLLALKNRSAIDFTEKMDVYSFGMTCFEVVSGRLPFEGELPDCRASHDLVIAGQRPKLPSDLDVWLKDLIEKCWNPIPNERPSFLEILRIFSAL